MPTITVKNIPEDLYRQLRTAAEINRRSINSEVIVCLERVLRNRRVTAEVTLARARQLRQKTGKHPVGASEFTAARNAGRS